MLDLVGMRTRLDERGSGRTSVFVHGLGGDLRSWDCLWPLLNDDRRSIRYDLRGFGESVAMFEDAFTHGEDLVSLLDALDIDACDLVGVSMGGGIALNFTLDHPERVRSLALLSPQIFGWDWSEDWRAYWKRITDVARAGALADAKRLWWEHPLFEATRLSEAAEHLQEEIARFAGRQWVVDRHSLVMPDIERIHELKVPTLLLTGLSDVDELRLMADILAASSDRIERIDIEGGHLLQMEKPNICANHIAAFHAIHSSTT